MKTYNTVNHSDGVIINSELHKSWIRFINEHNPKYFITLTIKELVDHEINTHLRKSTTYSRKNNKINTYDNEAISLCNRVLHYVNYDLYGRKYKKRNSFLTGFGCLEHQKNGQPHFHLVIDSEVDDLSLIYTFEHKLEKIKQTSKSGFDFQNIIEKEEQSQVSEYITKMMKKGVLNIGVLSRDGLLM